MATTGWRNLRRAFFVNRAMTLRQISVDPVGSIAGRDLTRFRIALRDLRTLATILDWLAVQEPPRVVHDVVTQDEYTHDVIVPWSERLVLVFDTT